MKHVNRAHPEKWKTGNWKFGFWNFPGFNTPNVALLICE